MSSIFFKEISLSFSSVRFFVLTGIFLLLFGLYFFNAAAHVSLIAVGMTHTGSSMPMTMNDMMLRPVFSDLCALVLYLTPFLAMDLYSRERSQGTIELLHTYPVSDFSVLMGKFLATLVVFMVMLLLSTSMMIVLAFMTDPDWGVVTSSYLGMLLLGSTVLSIGIFASALTWSPVIAVSLTFAISLILWTAGWFEKYFNGTMPGDAFRELSLAEHVSPFIHGMITLKDVSFFLVLSMFFLMLTFMVMDSGRR